MGITVSKSAVCIIGSLSLISLRVIKTALAQSQLMLAQRLVIAVTCMLTQGPVLSLVPHVGQVAQLPFR